MRRLTVIGLTLALLVVLAPSVAAESRAGSTVAAKASAPNLRYHRGTRFSCSTWTCATVTVNHHDILGSCQALAIEILGGYRPGHSARAMSVDKVTLTGDGRVVASRGYYHTSGGTITNLATGFQKVVGGTYGFRANVIGVRVRYSDGYLSPSVNHYSNLDVNRC